ncbi:MAG: RNA 3'-terminal phosphate cyclase [Deltaproteobacteria bacterium]|nr:RNA 3'-terminal phosphate cyclase [Deltaproteobacteria bacterium]
MILIDGSKGEGGGQILRSSLALSLVTGKPVQIVKIRAGRARPGLMKQHLTSVLSAAEVGSAEVKGASLGSTSLSFRPNPPRAGSYRFSIGSAGSATLVLQTVLPALLAASEPSRLVLEGGTHNPAAPPFDFLARVFAPRLAELAGTLALALERPGFYPRGGGRFTAVVTPRPFRRLDLLERGPLTRRMIVARVAGLPRHIAERELSVLRELLGFEAHEASIEELPASQGPGNVALVELEAGSLTEIVTGFGERGVSAERVAERVAAEASRFIEHGAPVGEHLADQLIVPMAMAGEGSFVTGPLTPHTRTQLELVPQFLPIAFETTELSGGRVRVEVGPRR